MGINLPPVLPSSGGNKPSVGSTSGWNHAQNTSVSQLQQKKDRQQATSSISRAMRRDSDDTPSTSISHPGGQGQAAVTSISDSASHDAKQSVDDDAADEKRHEYIQRLMSARRAKMRADAKKGISKNV
jgi:hypothetical protein